VNTLKISEIFYSIQGEGFNTGLPFIFIRLAGCSMRCEFCDTKYSWEKAKGKIMSVRDIIKKIKKYPCKNICITGGEPTEQDISELTKELKKRNYFILLETNGSRKIRGIFDWIVVSPKNFVYEENLEKANEIKIVITDRKDFELIKFLPCGKIVSLQPVDNDVKIIKECIEFIKESGLDFGLRLSYQLQKLLKIK